jgi:hypothetical protein
MLLLPKLLARRLEKRGGIPSYRLGKRVLFDRAELVSIVKANRSA